MTDFLHSLAFAASVTGPIFVVLMLGIALARAGLITEAFVDAGSKLVFNVTLPSLLFISISAADIAHTANIGLIAYGVFATLALFVMLEALATLLVPARAERGVVVQGAFRSNMAIVGLAFCVNAYGPAGLAAASIYMAPVTMLLNILSVVTLNRSLNRHAAARDTLLAIARNPLIIAILLALPMAWWQVRLPGILNRTGEYFAQMTLPLALLCTGASLSLAGLRDDLRSALLASLGKLLLAPFLLTAGAYALGFRGMDLGILFLLSASPTAAASYVMARAMGGKAGLAANIIVLTTIGSLISTSLGITLLRSLGWM